ncbi:terminase small subunit [Pediococcus pentosaceus]|uniref:hypothetical protein n=1 Tax=Pediococcus pentosaceus TaxID=1255 RepID=UPI0039823405
MAKLTQQQEKFAQLVAHGMSQTKAYKEAYNTGKMKPNTIWVKASQLANDGKVTVRISEIQEAIFDSVKWSQARSYAEKVEFLDKVKGTIEKDGRVSQGTANAFVSVVTELDKMLDSDLKRKAKADADLAEQKVKTFSDDSKDVTVNIRIPGEEPNDKD